LDECRLFWHGSTSFTSSIQDIIGAAQAVAAQGQSNDTIRNMIERIFRDSKTMVRNHFLLVLRLWRFV
jgi:hypothetical protein